MMSRLIAIIVAMVTLSISLFAADPDVSNVRAQQRRGTPYVDITYDLSDTDSSALSVSVVVSTDGGSSFSVPSDVSGHVGSGVVPGTGRTMLWNAGADLSARLFNNVRVRVTASDDTAPSGMALIPAGSFSMGDSFSEGSSNERPVHSIYVSAFYMDRYEVTNDEMCDVLNWAYGQGKLTVSASTVRNAEGNSQELLDLDDSDCRIQWTGSQFVMKSAKGSGYPCVEVTWYGAVAYCNYRTLKEGGGRTPCYSFSDWSCNWSATGYRLPTEAEWEKAARGGLSGQRFPWGANINHDNANYRANGSAYSYDTSPYTSYTYHPDYDDGGSPYTSPVDAFAANGYGLYDMAGNVWEWCWDWYGSSYYSSSPGSDPRGPASGSFRVLRGGCWNFYAYYCRVANRYYCYPAGSDSGLGFRAVLPPGP